MTRPVESRVPVLLFAASLGAMLAGCSDEPAAEKAKTTSSHVWRGQTDMYLEARDVAKDANAQLNAQGAALERARRGD